MRVRLLFALFLLAVCIPGLCDHEEFEETDMMPAPNRMDFDKDRVYFYTQSHRFNYSSYTRYEWYAFDRKTHLIVPMSAPPDDHAPGMVVLPPAIGNYPPGGGDEALDLMTSDGADYDSTVPYCGEGDTGDGSLEHGGVNFEFFAPLCRGAGAVEKLGPWLLAANRFSGEGGSQPAEGVSVLDVAAKKVVKTISFAASIIRLDPYTHQVWMVGPTGIMLLDSSADVKQRWYFYRDFSPSDHRATLFISDQPHASDGFAVIAWDLHVRDDEGWYKAVQALPAATRQQFTPFNFFEGRATFLGQRFPEVQPLVSFFIEPMEINMGDPEFERVFGAICDSPDDRVDKLLRETQVDNDYWTKTMGKKCIEARAAKQPKAP